jgi:2-(1,2-epoxy-1,2-dihydrophenyl)acetyl-CoA isomerase
MSEGVLVTLDEGLCTVTLNRPEHLNAFTATMLDRFNATLGDAAADERVRALLITGAGHGFCAGQDLNDRSVIPGDAPSDLGESLEQRNNPAIRTIRSMPKPVVMAVNGVAAGAGANLALAGDIVVAAKSATFVQSSARIGLIPDSGGTYFLPRRVGMARAMGLSLLGDPLPAATAAEWGLIWAVYDDADLIPEATAIGRSLAAGPTFAFAKIKQALYASGGNTLDTQLDLERDLQRVAGRSQDYRKGVAAFLEKRTPRYEGR